MEAYKADWGDGKVLKLEPVLKEPNEELIEILENFLEKAKEGKISSVFIIAQCELGRSISGHYIQGKDKRIDLFQLLGILDFKKAELRALIEESHAND